MSLRRTGHCFNFILLIGLAIIPFDSAILAQTPAPAQSAPPGKEPPSLVTPTPSAPSGVTPLGIEPASAAGTFVSSVTDFHNRLQDAVGLQIHGMVAGTYEYNFDRPSTGNNTLRVYDFFGSNSPELAQGELYIERAVPNQVGFVLDLNTANVGQIQMASRPSTGTCRDAPAPARRVRADGSIRRAPISLTQFRSEAKS